MILNSSWTNFVFSAIVIFIIGKTFLNPIISYYKNRNHTKHALASKKMGLHVVELVRVLTFIKLFATSLSIVFLPQYMLQITIASGMPQGLASLLYVFYQITFILMVIPGGYLVEVRRLKQLLLGIIVLEAGLFLSYSLANNFWEILLLQIGFGILVPISSSAEYAYIFKFNTAATRGEAIALYANTLRGAMIAGTFCGGLLVAHFGMRIVFLIACSLNLLALLYAIFFIPAIKPKHEIRIKKIAVENFDLRYVLKKLPSMLRNLNFLKTLLLVAIPLGLLEDGVVLFGLPLLLLKHNISQQIIGQLLSLFAIDFFIANKYVSKLASKINAENKFLFWGLCGIAVSLFLIWGLNLGGLSSIVFVAFGLLLLGIFRSFIVSPVIAYISHNQVTAIAGKNITFSVYKLFETFGRIIGPILIMQLFILGNYSASVYIILGVLYFIFAALLQYRAQ